jgi:hypothetical protein
VSELHRSARHRMRIISLLTIAFLVAGCGSRIPGRSSGPPVSATKSLTPETVTHLRHLLIGCWYGDQPTKEGGRKQWIAQRHSDGTFRIRFRISNGRGYVEEQVESGDWGVSSRFMVYVTKSLSNDTLREKVPASDPYYWDIYEILEVDSVHLEYLAVATGNRFLVRKVPFDFTMPQ